MRQSLVFVLLVALAAIWTSSSITSVQAAPTPAPTQSGCEICADKGDCSKAYLNGPGQYCGPWLDQASQRHACCCPREATCALGNYECKCKSAKTGAPINKQTPAPAPTKAASKKWVTLAIVFFVVGGLIAAGIYFFMKSRRANDTREFSEVHETTVYAHNGAAHHGYASAPEPAPYAQPAPVHQPVYYQPAPAASAPMAYKEVHHHHHEERRRGGGMGTGAGIAVGAAAGLVGGMLIGNAMADGGSREDHHHHHTAYEYTNNDDGDTFAGDF